MRPSAIGQILKFGLVGFANTAVGLSVIYLCKILGLADVPANVVGYACGLLLSFHLNKNWTFDRRDSNRGATVIPFVCAFAIAYATNLGALLLFLHIGVNSYVAQALSMPVYTGVFYLLCAYFVFRPKTGGT